MNNETRLWIVTVVDYGETCDGKARVLKVCKTELDARKFMKDDMTDWYEMRKDEGIEIDYAGMRATFDYDTDTGCEWNIEQVRIPADLLN